MRAQKIQHCVMVVKCLLIILVVLKALFFWRFTGPNVIVQYSIISSTPFYDYKFGEEIIRKLNYS